MMMQKKSIRGNFKIKGLVGGALCVGMRSPEFHDGGTYHTDIQY